MKGVGDKTWKGIQTRKSQKETDWREGKSRPSIFPFSPLLDQATTTSTWTQPQHFIRSWCQSDFLSSLSHFNLKVESRGDLFSVQWKKKEKQITLAHNHRDNNEEKRKSSSFLIHPSDQTMEKYLQFCRSHLVRSPPVLWLTLILCVYRWLFFSLRYLKLFRFVYFSVFSNCYSFKFLQIADTAIFPFIYYPSPYSWVSLF